MATKEEFLESYVPRFTTWASKAAENDRTTPSKERVESGWTIEQPTHSLFNWYMNRTDIRINEVEARLDWLEDQLCQLQNAQQS